MTSSISLSEVIFAYNKKKVLDIQSLEIQQSEKVFIYGPSGCGKSTLLNLLSGVLQPQNGDVTILEKKLTSLSQAKKDQFRGDHIGFIFQNFNLVPYLTIRENIILPLKASKSRFQSLKGSIDQEIEYLVKQLKIYEYIDSPVQNLSIGQQQRVAAARALIGNPQMIIADEPTSSLDDDVTDDFMRLLINEHEKKNFSLVFVSHDQRLARFFDRKINLQEINQVGESQ